MQRICSPGPLAAWSVVGLLGWLSCAGVAQAQPVGLDLVSARSVSGQFIVLTRPGAPASWLRLEAGTDRNYLHLDPTVLPSSCERIKQELWRSLGSITPWSGQVYLALHPAVSAEDTVTIISQRFQNGWQYRVELPDTVERMRYARAMVEVLLLEIANRNAGERSAEIPTWLREGLTRQLLVTSEAELLPQPARSALNGVNLSSTLFEGRHKSPLASAHEGFHNRAPLTFEELSWPSAGQLDGPGGKFYAESAQLFVDDLMRLRDGQTCLRAMVEELPQRYNWQFAFLRAFGAFFQRPLDVEKWWALQILQFTGHDLGQAWPEEQSWAKLDQAVRSAVAIRTGTNQLPLSSEVTLQTIIGSWEPKSQTQALREKLRELRWLVPHLARDHAALAEEYCKVIETYLGERDRTGFLPFRKGAARHQATEGALRELGMLDTRLSTAKPRPKAAANLQALATH